MRVRAFAIAALTWLGALSCLVLGCPRPAQALEFQCIEASKYRNLLRVFAEDPEAFLSYFKVQRAQRPQPDACRAVVVSGTLEPGDARKLLDQIIKSRGWLATLYLVHTGGNAEEEVKLATVIRTFWLKTRYYNFNTALYIPDFITGQASPGPSSTTTWPPTPATEEPLKRGLDDYFRSVDRKLPPAIGKFGCLESCVSFYLAGLDRLVRSGGPNSAGTIDQKTDQTASDTGQNVRLALQLWLDNRKFDKDANPLPTAATLATARRFPPGGAQTVRNDCSIEIDAASGSQEQIQSTVEALAQKKFDRFFRVDTLLPRFDALRTSLSRLEACLAGTYDRRRLAAFRKECGDKCDLDTMDSAFTERASELMKTFE